MLAAALLGRLTGIMMDPVLFIPALLTVLKLKQKPMWLQILVATLVSVLVAALFAIALAQKQIAMGRNPFLSLPFYIVGGFIWSIIFTGIGALWRKTPKDSSNL